MSHNTSAQKPMMAEPAATSTTPTHPVPCRLPRVTIQFCTQCKWMLRAAYYAQELLSTFSVSLGEVALQPSTGGTFVVAIHHDDGAGADAGSAIVLWDRKTDGGFPETKELKRRVRDVIEPGRDLGHVDRHRAGSEAKGAEDTAAATTEKEDGDGGGGSGGGEGCQDCQ